MIAIGSNSFICDKTGVLRVADVTYLHSCMFFSRIQMACEPENVGLAEYVGSTCRLASALLAIVSLRGSNRQLNKYIRVIRCEIP
jgi:hypothetical protein